MQEVRSFVRGGFHVSLPAAAGAPAGEDGASDIVDTGRFGMVRMLYCTVRSVVWARIAPAVNSEVPAPTQHLYLYEQLSKLAERRCCVAWAWNP